MNDYISRHGEWILCSERLPEVGDKVLVSTKNTVFAEVFKGTHESVDSWWWTNNTIKIIYAWMPLPEPYKGEEAGVSMLQGEDIGLLYKYAEGKFGYPIMTHDMASQEFWEKLKHEAENDFFDLCMNAECKGVQNEKSNTIDIGNGFSITANASQRVQRVENTLHDTDGQLTRAVNDQGEVDLQGQIQHKGRAD